MLLHVYFPVSTNCTQVAHDYRLVYSCGIVKDKQTSKQKKEYIETLVQTVVGGGGGGGLRVQIDR